MNLERVRRVAMAFPQVEERPHFERTSFRVRGKIFATAPPDGRSVNVFVAEEDRQRAIAFDPRAFEKLKWGDKVVGLTVDLAVADAALIDELLYLAWRRKAPKRLVASFKRAGPSEQTSQRPGCKPGD